MVKKIALVLALFVYFLTPSSYGKDILEDIPLAAHLKERYTDDLPELIKRRHIRVLTTFNRTNFFIANSRTYGFEYSLLKDYEKFLNRGIKRRELKITLEFIPVSRDRLIPLLLEGYGDIAAAGLTITSERLKKVDFTDPYLTNVREVVVVHRSVKGIEKAEDLSGKTVYVRRTSSYYESLKLLNSKLTLKGLKPVRVEPADESLETEDILEMVNSGAIKITIADSHIARIWSRVFKNIRVLDGAAVREGGKIAWMVRKDNPLLKKSLNRFIKSHRKGTRIGNIYFNRYFKNTRWIKNPLDKDIARKPYIRLFKKYGKKYGFDWLFLMAVAYQESGLNNKKRSPSGAVGIMQVRPATARDKNIGIRNIYRLENNIHAGTKYLAFLRDRYFSDPELKERDRLRFTLAAYNAGPLKIKKARRVAKKMGLNPNRWFRNVEIAVLKTIGQETVQYVSNINKYYILYKLHFENVEKRKALKKQAVR